MNSSRNSEIKSKGELSLTETNELEDVLKEAIASVKPGNNFNSLIGCLINVQTNSEQPNTNTPSYQPKHKFYKSKEKKQSRKESDNFEHKRLLTDRVKKNILDQGLEAAIPDVTTPHFKAGNNLNLTLH